MVEFATLLTKPNGYHLNLCVIVNDKSLSFSLFCTLYLKSTFADCNHSLVWDCKGSKIFPSFVKFLTSKDPDDGTKQAAVEELISLEEHLKTHVWNFLHCHWVTTCIKNYHVFMYIRWKFNYFTYMFRDPMWTGKIFPLLIWVWHQSCTILRWLLVITRNGLCLKTWLMCTITLRYAITFSTISLPLFIFLLKAIGAWIHFQFDSIDYKLWV